MDKVNVRRMPSLGSTVITIVVLVYVLICLGVASQRGYPPLGVFWNDIAPYLIAVVPFLIPVFDDGPEYRHRLRIVVIVSISLGLGAINAASGRPVPRSGLSPGIPMYAAFMLPVAIAYVVFWERTSANLLNKVRRFRPDEDLRGNPGETRGNPGHNIYCPARRVGLIPSKSK